MCGTYSRMFQFNWVSLVLVVWNSTTIFWQRASGQDEIADSSKIVVTVDGKAVEPRRLYDTGDGAQDARLVDVGIWLKLGAGREFHFTKGGKFDDMIYVMTPGQPRRLVGVVFHGRSRDSKLAGPLASLNGDEMQRLWGVKLDLWSGEIAEKLKQIDPDRTCITVGHMFGRTPRTGPLPHEDSMPPLPKEITTLVIDSTSSDGIGNLDELRKLTKLRSLSVRLAPDVAFDGSLLADTTQLEFLRINSTRIKEIAALKSLKQLVELDLKHCPELTDLSFVKSMGNLTKLNIDGTQVADLSPLTGVPKLSEIDARIAPVSTFPGQMPGLRELVITTSKVDAKDYFEFRRQNPGCRVVFGWTQLLQTILKPSTKTRIRTGIPGERPPRDEKTLFESKDAAEIKQLITGIQFIETRGFWGGTFCGGDPSFEFYDGDKLIITLGFNPCGHSFKCSEVFGGDAHLTPRSLDFLIDWLVERNVTGPLQELKEDWERDVETHLTEKEIVRATAGMSPTLAMSFLSGEPGSRIALKDFRTALLREMPEKSQQVEVLLRLYGMTNFGLYSRRLVCGWVDGELATYDTKTLAAVVERALKADDRQLRRGAVRLWRVEDSPLEQWRPEDIAELHRIIVLVEQEARFYSIRLESLEDLIRWKNDFSDAEFDHRLTALLYDPIPQVRHHAMIAAGKLQHKPAIDILMRVVKENKVESRPLPDIPFAESEDVTDEADDREEPCTDADAAALALGYLRHAAAMPLIAATKPQTPLTEVALALLGQGEHLKPEHFGRREFQVGELPRELQQELQLAAVQAVIRSKGQYGLKLAIDYSHFHRSIDEADIFSNLAQMLRSENAPGSDELKDCRLPGPLEKWFNKYGAEYLKRFEGKQ